MSDNVFCSLSLQDQISGATHPKNSHRLHGQHVQGFLNVIDIKIVIRASF